MGTPLFKPADVEQKLAGIISKLSDNEKAALTKILTGPVPGEKRTGKRKRFLIPANIDCQNQSFYSRIENLSERGAFIITDHLIPTGNEVFLTFSVLNFEFPVRLRAEVIRITKHGIGLKFKPSSALSHRLAIEKLADAVNPQPVKV